MKNLKKGFVVTLIITVIILLLFSGYVYFQSSKITFFPGQNSCTGETNTKDFICESATPKLGGANMRVDVFGDDGDVGHILVNGQIVGWKCNNSNFSFERTNTDIKIFREISNKNCDENEMLSYAFKIQINNIPTGTYKVVLLDRVKENDSSFYDIENIWQNGIIIK